MLPVVLCESNCPSANYFMTIFITGIGPSLEFLSSLLFLLSASPPGSAMSSSPAARSLFLPHRFPSRFVRVERVRPLIHFARPLRFNGVRQRERYFPCHRIETFVKWFCTTGTKNELDEFIGMSSTGMRITRHRLFNLLKSIKRGVFSFSFFTALASITMKYPIHTRSSSSSSYTQKFDTIGVPIMLPGPNRNKSPRVSMKRIRFWIRWYREGKETSRNDASIGLDCSRCWKWRV